MKKIFLIMLAPFAFLSASLAQVTQTASDSIILERMNQETRPHTVYAKTDSAIITTTAGELLEFDFFCRIYYIHYTDQTDTTLTARHYLVVNESSGNLLEVNTRNDAAPNNLATWRIILPEPELDTVRLSWTGMFNCGYYPLDSVVITNRANGEKVVFHYPDTVYVSSENTLPFQYGDTLIMQGFISGKDAFQYQKEHLIPLTQDTFITFAFFDEQAFVDTSEITVIDLLIKLTEPLRCYNNSSYLPDCDWSNFQIINTQSDLDSLFACDASLVLPIVDFSSQSLVLGRGWTPETASASDYTFSFIKNCSGDYVIKIDISPLNGKTITYIYSWMLIVNEVIQSNEQIKLRVYSEKSLKKSACSYTI